MRLSWETLQFRRQKMQEHHLCQTRSETSPTLHDLVTRCQVHKCNKYCMKSYKKAAYLVYVSVITSFGIFILAKVCTSPCQCRVLCISSDWGPADVVARRIEGFLRCGIRTGFCRTAGLWWEPCGRRWPSFFQPYPSWWKSCFTPTVARTKRPWLWTATPTPWTSTNDAKRNFIYRQLHKYGPIATNFSTSQLSIV